MLLSAPGVLKPDELALVRGWLAQAHDRRISSGSIAW
jgi:hypothetical protein